MNIKRKMELISKLNIGSLPKAMLALVVLEIIPAVDLELFQHNTSPHEIIRILSPMGLNIVGVRMPEKKENDKHVATLCISPNAHNASFLEKLVWCCERTDKVNPAFDIAYGAMMGYPLSAIEGFVTGQKLPRENYPDELKDDLLTTFMLSKSRWQEELLVIKSWRNALATNAPQILKELDSVQVW